MMITTWQGHFHGYSHVNNNNNFGSFIAYIPTLDRSMRFTMTYYIHKKPHSYAYNPNILNIYIMLYIIKYIYLDNYMYIYIYIII